MPTTREISGCFSSPYGRSPLFGYPCPMPRHPSGAQDSIGRSGVKTTGVLLELAKPSGEKQGRSVIMFTRQWEEKMNATVFQNASAEKLQATLNEFLKTIVQRVNTAEQLPVVRFVSQSESTWHTEVTTASRTKAGSQTHHQITVVIFWD